MTTSTLHILLEERPSAHGTSAEGGTDEGRAHTSGALEDAAGDGTGSHRVHNVVLGTDSVQARVCQVVVDG